MELPFENAKRTVWLVKDRNLFLQQMRPLIRINKLDVLEITQSLSDRDFDYLEIASYRSETKFEDPDAILVFDGKKDVYWDLMEPEAADFYMKRITQLSESNASFSGERGLTQRDWRKRFEALNAL